MSDTPLAGRVAVVSGGGRGLGRSFCRALARQGAKVVVNNRNRVTDADGRGPADHVAAEIVAGGGEAVAEHSDAADPAGYGRIILVGSTGGLHGDAGLSAYAASIGRRPAAERAGSQPRSAARPAGRERARRAARVPGGRGRVQRPDVGWSVMSWGPLLVNLAVTAGLVALLMLATFGYAMRTRVHAIMDTIWPLGFVLIAVVTFGLSAGSGVAGRRVLALGYTGSGCSRSTWRGPRGRRTPITFGAPVASSPSAALRGWRRGLANRI